MIQKIKALEPISRKLEPMGSQRSYWNAAVQDYADNFLDNFNQHTTYVVSETMGKEIYDFHFEENGKSIEEVLQCLKDNVDTPNLNPASGGHFGYIPGGGVYTTALGDYLAAVTNRYAGIFFACPGGVRMENMLLRWMCEMVGYPTTALGNLTSGGSIANLSAITTARDAKGIKAKDIERSVIYMTAQLHHCVQKSLRIAGMRECIIRYIPMDDHFKMKPKDLNQQIQKDIAQGLLPFMVFASAGTTDTGAIDPLEAIGIIAQDNDLWFHVDAAYGGFFMLSDTLKPAFKGVELSDSIAIDPHKGLFLSYGIGAILIKDTAALYETHRYTANYMQDAFTLDEDPSPADLSPELTKHFRGLRMWISLQLLGLAPFKAALDEKILLCHYFYKEVQKLGFEVGPEPDLSIAIFRYLPKNRNANAFNQEIVDRIMQDGRIFLSSTTLDGVYWIRFAVLSFRTHLEQVELALRLLKKLV
ncbi:MAG: aminotransferase class V-fold PLP-dependent enzyme [Maribacter sp.]|nr:aminotransferase class V-fold PLP-dependent enzyme [Maribacter sp.]